MLDFIRGDKQLLFNNAQKGYSIGIDKSLSSRNSLLLEGVQESNECKKSSIYLDGETGNLYFRQNIHLF